MKTMKNTFFVLLYLCSFVHVRSEVVNNEEDPGEQICDTSLVLVDLLVLTVATQENDAFNQFLRSTKKYGLDVQILGMGQKWEGGDMAAGIGGGFKVNLLAKAMEKLKDNANMIVMFVDSYDLVITAGPGELKKTFKKFDAKVVFGAEDFCWPDRTLKEVYPEVKPNEKRFLNSGGFIGYARDVYEMVTSVKIEDSDDDQLFYTKIFLNPSYNENDKIRLDTKAEIFQNLHGALDEVDLKFKGSSSFLYNSRTGVVPMVIHGNGPIKVEFHGLANYLADQWTPTSGCQSCQESKVHLDPAHSEDYPEVMVALFLDHPIPFASLFFNRVAGLSYPKDKINLVIYYQVTFHDADVAKFKEQHDKLYKTLTVFGPEKEMSHIAAHNDALKLCSQQQCDYLLIVDGEAQFENVNTLTHLIEQNRTMIGPLLSRPQHLWSNFWGALSSDGFYKRSPDYVDIVKGNKRGLWNVPYLSLTYLIQGHIIKDLQGAYGNKDMDTDMALCQHMREKNIFMYVDNQDYYGHQTNSDAFDTKHLHNDMYSILENPYTWEQQYVHPEYHTAMLPKTVNEQPCPDVFWVPVVSPTFCTHLIEEMEYFGEWSNGKAQDPRLSGGYENVPTVDIHTNQIGWERQWLQILKTYIAPVSEKVYMGYHSEARATMNFVVRYKPSEQSFLRPHDDSSTYSINIALNEPGIDYEGGGTRFVRHKCEVVKSRLGWLVMHPGRLTHHHEGLETTNGTRYIMVSFIDP